MSKISVVMIVQNEEVLLPRCLESVKGFDEIIISDSGSKDRTVEIAKQYTDKLYSFPWCDDFAKSRNFAKSKATGDWILSIDADEFLHDMAAVREAVYLAEAQGLKAVNCSLIAEDNGQQTEFPRLFKNDPEVNWVGAVHNHLSVLGKHVGDVKITYGYSPAHASDPDRAYRILQKEVESRPDAVREMFYLGREHWYRREYDKCFTIMAKYVEQSRYLAEKAEAFLIMARAAWAMKMGDVARDACSQALIINANFKEAILFMAELSFEHNAVQWRKMAETANNEGVLFVRT